MKNKQTNQSFSTASSVWFFFLFTCGTTVCDLSLAPHSLWSYLCWNIGRENKRKEHWASQLFSTTEIRWVLKTQESENYTDPFSELTFKHHFEGQLWKIFISLFFFFSISWKDKQKQHKEIHFKRQCENSIKHKAFFLRC